MKKISEHLGAIIAVLAGVALLISVCVGPASTGIKEFFGNTVGTYTEKSQNMLGGIVGSKKYEVTWEQGGLDVDGTEVENSKRIRSGHIEVGKNIKATAPDDGYTYWIRVYDANGEFLGTAYQDIGFVRDNTTNSSPNPLDVDQVSIIYPEAKTIRIALRKGETIITPGDYGMVFSIEPISTGYRERTSDDHEMFLYTIDDEGNYTSGKLKLPTSYTTTGAKTPLIVFAQGSDDYISIFSSTMTVHYEEYYNYLRDCGYAIFECYGWGNKLPSGRGTWATPTNNKSYIEGIKYVLKNYNIDESNIFVSCKSLGGIQALSLYHEESIPVKAVGMFAPSLDLVYYNFGFSQKERVASHKDFGFTEDINGVMTGETVVKDSALLSYFRENYDIIANQNPYYIGLQTSEDDIHSSLFGVYSNFENRKITLSTNRPLKVWMAEDDTNVPIAPVKHLVNNLQNSGYQAELRTMPNGTGGHHAVDTADTALQTTNVTTKLGVHYDSVPTAYYELREYFDSFLN